MLTRLKWKLVPVRLEIVLILSQGSCTISIEHTRWNLLGTWVMSNLISVYLETMLVSVQDRCTVCAIRTIGSVIIFYTPDGTPR
jgi:hypothetical protein